MFQDLKEILLAGVDGYVTIQTSPNQQVEATPPAPAYPTGTEGQPEGFRPGILDTLTANSGQLFLVSGLVLAVALVLKNG